MFLECGPELPTLRSELLVPFFLAPPVSYFYGLGFVIKPYWMLEVPLFDPVLDLVYLGISP